MFFGVGEVLVFFIMAGNEKSQTETHWTQIKTDERQVSQKIKGYFQKESIF